MCEPFMLQHTGLTVAAHQRRTVDNFICLRSLAPDLPIIPVLQGWHASDYLRCADRYAAAGIELAAEPVVGLGSVCRRQTTAEIDVITDLLAGLGLRLHGFGVKITGLGALRTATGSCRRTRWPGRSAAATSAAAGQAMPPRPTAHGSRWPGGPGPGLRRGQPAAHPPFPRHEPPAVPELVT